MHIEKLPRFQLAQLPTPVEKLVRLPRELGGPEWLIKRDDETGLALGGHKMRKLEFLVGAGGFMARSLRGIHFPGNNMPSL